MMFCCCCVVPMMAWMTILGLLCVPTIEDAFASFAYANLRGFPLMIAGSMVTIRHFTYCMGDYLGCVKKEAADDLVMMFSWENGIGNFVPFSMSALKQGRLEMPIHFSHATYRAIAHDPKAGRPRDYFVFSHKSDLPAGTLPDGEPDILLNFDTGSPEHTARRKLIGDMLPSLKFKRKVVPEFKVPPGVEAKAAVHQLGALEKVTGGALKRQVFDLVGYNVFWQLFGVDIGEHLADHFVYDATLAPGVLGFPLFGFQGAKLQEIRAKIHAKVASGDIAKAFVAEAKERGMDGEKRLSEMVWIAMFAGYGGTGNLAFSTVQHVLLDPAKYVPLYRNDPKAFMLEAARLYPPVAGMNPVAYRKATEHKLANGVVLKPQPGDIAVILSSGSNMDPNVFKEPHAFRPGRPNATKLLSWNNELDAFASCDSVAGCAAAPRGCPGTWLSLHVATEAVGFFVGGLEAAGLAGAGAGKRGEEL
mmetsp:Transcript_74319/g.193613  ORF Transcript_74319/g.193613 Transcript_74319/m.193613 type:complete len:475 (+) Transcript_74319:71-1495(+)